MRPSIPHYVTPRAAALVDVLERVLARRWVRLVLFAGTFLGCWLLSSGIAHALGA